MGVPMTSDKAKEMKIRLQERIRLYRDSPSVSATYIDLAHITEDLISLIDNEGTLGFHSNDQR